MTSEHESEAQMETQLLQRLQGLGYAYIKIDDEQALNAHFRAELNQRNAASLNGVPLSDREFSVVLNELIGAKNHYVIAELLRGSDTMPYGKISIQRDDNTKLFLQVFDGKDYRQNHYECTHQVTVQGKHENRYDVLILVNGMPLAQIELKRRGEDFNTAFAQVLRYRNESQKFAPLFKLIQLYVISSGLDTRYFANGDGALNANFAFYWTDRENRWLNKLADFTDSFFSLERFHSMIARYTIFDSAHKKMLIMRPYQIYATEAVIKQAIEYPDKNGFIWHTTGSGKTITAFKTARLLAQTTAAEKVIFLIDRNDLDKQTVRNFSAYLPKGANGETSLDRTTDTRVLVDQLASHDHALIVTTIQKLNSAVANDRYKRVLADFHERRVAFIEDEAHRSQFGLMRKNVNRWFKNAQHFGFTGTPIFPENIGADGRTTADLYDQCLHRYLIKDAIRDKNVLPFTVQYLNTVRGKKIVTDAEVPGIDAKEAMENEQRLMLIAQHIMFNHDQFTKQRHYNAILTAPNTRVALKYYHLFQDLNAQAAPERRLNVTTIYTWAANELDNEDHQDQEDMTSRQGLDKVIEDYNHQYAQNFSSDKFKDYADDVGKRMQEFDPQTPEQNIDVLIVVNMFLTGFDSPKLSTLYVDRKLQWHSLIQAYSRTNRVELKEKPSGNIIAYRNLKQATDDAVSLFSAGDADQFFAPDYAKLAAEFEQAIAKLHEIAPTPMAVDDLHNAGEKALKAYVLAFRSLARIYNKLRVYDDFEWAKFPGFSDQEFQDYRGKYLALRPDTPGGDGPVSILEDIDFELSLFETDQIDVDYIVNLINAIDLDTDATKNAGIRRISALLDNQPQLKSKAALLKKFLEEVVATLPPEADVSVALTKFLEESKRLAIKSFMAETHLPEAVIDQQLDDYAFYGELDGQALSKTLTAQGADFGTVIKLRKSLTSFVKETAAKYTF